MSIPTIQEDGVTRPMDAEEALQQAADEAAAAAEAAEAAAAEAQAAADRQAAIDHAKSLGFTDAMIAAMYPALVG